MGRCRDSGGGSASRRSLAGRSPRRRCHSRSRRPSLHRSRRRRKPTLPGRMGCSAAPCWLPGDCRCRLCRRMCTCVMRVAMRDSRQHLRRCNRITHVHAHHTLANGCKPQTADSFSPRQTVDLSPLRTVDPRVEATFAGSALQTQTVKTTKSGDAQVTASRLTAPLSTPSHAHNRTSLQHGACCSLTASVS